jgi:hypothetical protein
MNRLLGTLIAAVFPASVCYADVFDLSFPSGLTVNLVGSDVSASVEGWAMVRFAEPIGTAWYASCYDQRFYVRMTTYTARQLITLATLAKATGQKVTKIKGATPDPSISNICQLYWMQVE